ncbi:MAG: DNA adenine methylase [Roseitalea sp.]|nr:DNA adenine methylase [Roseitalea sp.]MBO6950966.1 DNA adenine methylase [Rhizobiaceae bacterium]MBO6591047.1 DNA adenine methylase [Roseitalea sp.]MBO6599695.1 DNA adenine methylase [Roseitalea sp.]MBO6611451.1 DNA adenine methylase [Roseitalea sp.]
MTYPGGKNAAGAYQRIINYMPPHATYVEAFLGSGAVLRNKRPADRNIGIDLSAEALALCLDLAAGNTSHLSLIEDDALALLPVLKTMLDDRRLIDRPDTLIYADPPYVMDTRKGGALYDHEMTDADHERLLATLRSARCMVMISGYRSPLYDAALTGWHRIDYKAQTRQGLADESLWLNFRPPLELHDYGHLGADYRERERIRRKRRRWADKIAGMDRLERLAVMDALKAAGGAE